MKCPYPSYQVKENLMVRLGVKESQIQVRATGLGGASCSICSLRELTPHVPLVTFPAFAHFSPLPEGERLRSPKIILGAANGEGRSKKRSAQGCFFF